VSRAGFRRKLVETPQAVDLMFAQVVEDVPGRPPDRHGVFHRIKGCVRRLMVKAARRRSATVLNPTRCISGRCGATATRRDHQVGWLVFFSHDSLAAICGTLITDFRKLHPSAFKLPCQGDSQGPIAAHIVTTLLPGEKAREETIQQQFTFRILS
jgi:hypothetical protein